MNTDRMSTATSGAAAAAAGGRTGRPPAPGTGSGRLRTARRQGRRPAALVVLESVLGVQAVLAFATAAVACHAAWNTADFGVFFRAGLVGAVSVVLVSVTALPVILLHQRLGSSRRSGLPMALVGQGLVALVTLYAWTHTDLLHAGVIVLGLGGPVLAVALAVLPATRRFANAPATGITGAPAVAAPGPHQ